MQNFTFSYPTKVYFGEGALDCALPEELAQAGKTVMLAYGGGSIKKNGMGGSFHSFAVLDPAYTLSAPMKQALSGAFDMLSHSMETYFGKPYDNNLSDRIALVNMRCVIDNTRAMVAANEVAKQGRGRWIGSFCRRFSWGIMGVH